MKNQITEQDMAVLRDIAANQLSPLEKMVNFIYKNYNALSIIDARVVAKDILDKWQGNWDSKQNTIRFVKSNPTHVKSQNNLLN